MSSAGFPGYSSSSRQLPRTQAIGAKQNLYIAWCISGEGTMCVSAHHRKCGSGDGGQEWSVFLGWVCTYVSYAILPSTEVAYLSSFCGHGKPSSCRTISRRRTTAILFSPTLIWIFFLPSSGAFYLVKDILLGGGKQRW